LLAYVYANFLALIKKSNKRVDALVEFPHAKYQSPARGASSNNKKLFQTVMKQFDALNCADETGQFVLAHSTSYFTEFMSLFAAKSYLWPSTCE